MQRYCLIHANGTPFEEFWQSDNNSETVENVEDLEGVVINCVSLSPEAIGGVCAYLNVFDIQGDFMAIKTMDGEDLDSEQMSELYEEKENHKFMCTLINLDMEVEGKFYFNSDDFIKGVDLCRSLLGFEVRSDSGKEIHHWDEFEAMGVMYE